MKKLNLGHAFECLKSGNFPGSPMAIHHIQDKLIALEGNQLFISVLRETAAKDIDEAIKSVLDAYTVSPDLINEMVGFELVDDILQFVKDRKEYLPQQPEDDLPIGVFQQPGLWGNLGDN